MIVCNLDPEQKQVLFQTVSADLMAMSKSGKPFNLKDYVKDIYNLFKKGGFDEPTSITYASLIPQNIKLLAGLDSAIDDYLEPSIGEIFQASRKMSDVDYVLQYLGVAPSAQETQGGKDADRENELDDLKKKNAIKSTPKENGAVFSARPNSLNTTTGDSQEVGREHSYGFISYMIENKIIDSKKSGYYLALMNAEGVITDNETQNKGFQSGLVQVITDKNGDPIYFDEQYNRVTADTGKLVFFRMRGGDSEFTKAISSLQTMNELEKTLGNTAENIQRDLQEQHKEIQKKKEYVQGGKGRKIVQEITGANNGYLIQLKPSDSPNRLPLGDAVDLSSGTIYIDTKTGRQRNFFIRGSHKKPIQFSTNSVQSLGPEFLSDAADILLGAYVENGEVKRITDEFGDPDNENLLAYRTKFRYALFGNNKTLSIGQDGNVYIGPEGKKVKVSDDLAEAKLQVISALTVNPANGFTHSINVFDEIQDYIPFFERSGKNLMLKKEGMSNKDYKKFIQKNSITFAKYNADGNFVEVNGYLTFKTPSEEINRIDAEALKPKAETLAATAKTKYSTTISSTIYELKPGITDEEIQTIYDNYVSLMGRVRKDKEISFDTFKNLLKVYQVYNYKDTYIFGHYDTNNGVFITRVNSSPSSKELLAEALPNLVNKGLDFISFVPEDVAAKYKRSGYKVTKEGFDYDFKGEKMVKYAAVSSDSIVKRIFGKNLNKVSAEDLEKYNELLPLKYAPVEINADLIKESGREASKILETYLKQFGITVKDINEIKDKLSIDEVGFADILSKIAYIKDKSNLPPVAGEFIAYMMQHNSLVKDIIQDLSKTENYKNLDKTQYFKIIGNLISQDLQNKLEGKYSESLVQKIKQLLIKFFETVGLIQIDMINTNIGIITNNILQQNKKLITSSLYKPGAFGKTTKQVSIEDALAKDKFGSDIIYKLAAVGFILTGSTALSEQGTILRPDENPLHDIDWVSPFSRKETEEKFLSVYQDAIKVRDIKGDGYTTDTYIIAPEGHSIIDYVTSNYNGKIIIQSYSVRNDSTGEVVGTYKLERDKETNENKEVATGVEAKVIDFFIYDDYSNRNKNAPFSYTSKQGTVINLANWKDIFAAKLEWARYKDIWDYNRFIPKEEARFPKEVSAKPEEPVTSIPTIEELNEDLDILSDLETPEYKAPDDKTLNKLKKQGLVNQDVTEEQVKAAEKWYATHPMSKYIPFNQMFDQINTANPESIATFNKQGITLYKGSNSTDLYHEAWHGFTQRFLTETERNNMYSEVSKMKGSFTDYEGNTVEFSKANSKQLEEYLAEDFRKFMLAGGKAPKSTPAKVKSIFEKILDILKILFGYDLTDGFSNNQASFSLNEIYNNLKIGNIRSQPIDFDKAEFDSLNKINPVSERYKSLSETLSYSDAMLVVDSLDSFFSEHSDAQNRINGSSEFTSLLLSDPKERANAYNGALLRMINEYKSVVGLRKQAHKENNKEDYDRHLRKEKILEFTIANFSPNSTKGQTITVDDIIDAAKTNKGVIAYHMQKSKYLNFEERFVIEDIEDKVKNDKDGYGHLSGNEKSMKELAADEVLYTIRGLFEYDKEGKPVKNELGFNSLVKFDTAWNRIQQVTEGSFDINDQFQALTEAAVSDQMVSQLITKMGNPNRYANSNFTDEAKEDKTAIILQNNLWTNFRNAFGGKRIPLVQLTIDIIRDSAKNEVSAIEIKPGKAQTETQKIARDWDSLFNSPVVLSSRERYIKSRPQNATVKEIEKFKGNELIIENVVADFENSYMSNPIPFLTALGMEIPDVPQMRKVLSDTLSIFPKALMEKLKFINNYNKGVKTGKIKIGSVSELIDLPINGKDERGGYNELLSYVAKYSPQYGSTMVSTAKGDARWELSLRSTASQMIDYWNKANSYEDLISNPRMAHLDVLRNPNIKNLIITRDTFGEDLSSRELKKKRSGRERTSGIELLNSSGVALLTNGNFTGFSTDSAEADEITQTLQNFYSYVLYGVSEGTRHADKSTSYWYKIRFSNGRKHFIPISDFANYSRLNNAKEDRNNTDGMRTAVRQFLKYISSETSRINKLVNENDPSGNVLVGDRTLKEVGSEFVAFEDVLGMDDKGNKLSEIIKKNYLSNDFYELLTTSDDPKVVKLKSQLESNILDYINTQIDNFKADLEGVNLFKKDHLMNSLRGEVTGAVGITPKIKNNPESYMEFVDEALITGYVVNDWIQKYETTSLFYGDVALYNHLKEEFHKRNAGIAATGTIPRSDDAMNALLNGDLAGRYIDSPWFKSSALTANKPDYNGFMNSAILEDTKVASVYTEDYIKAALDYEKKRLGVKKLDADTEKEIRASFDEYTKMKEGDAQGWITFDSYRALLNRLGKWSPYQEDMYNQIMDGKNVSTSDLAKFFPIKKMQYWGPLKTDSGIPVVAFHKFSLMPLIPTLVKGTNLEVLHNKMVSQGIDYATFQSGSKISTITTNGKIDKFYKDKTGKDRSVPAFRDADYRFTPNTIFLDYMKDQLEIADEYKGSTIFSTQLRKLVEIGLVENGVPTDFSPKVKGANKRMVAWEKLSEDEKKEKSRNYRMLLNYEGLVKKLTEFKMRELERDADIKYVNGTAVLSDKLLDFVKKELTRQDLAEHEIDFIKYDSQKGDLVYDLSLHPSADRIERLLTAMVYKRLIRQKINGEALIQVSGVGFEPALLRKPTEEEKERYGTNFLPFYRKKADGSTAAMKVKIAIQGDFKKLLNHPDVIALVKSSKGRMTKLEALNQKIKDEGWLDEGENRQMITLSGVRIPVQGINSMEFAEVYEFLPENAGNMIILPSEVVAKSGSDFDIDKLTMMFPSLVSTSKGVSTVKYNSQYEGKQESLRNELNDLYKKKDGVLDKIMNLIKREEEEGTINVREDLKKEINKLKETRTNLLYELTYNISNYDTINQEIDNIEEDLNEIFEGLFQISAAVKNLKTTELDPLIQEIDIKKVQIASGSSKGIENELLKSVVDILTLEQNFTEITTPNSTSLLTPLAEKYSQFARKYNAYDTVQNNGDSYMHNGKKRISATRIFELGYNRYKQISNSIGKRTLGLGAVDNTYNSIFNRVNFYMQPYFSMTIGKGEAKEEKSFSQTIRMPHNTIMVDGLPAISLSHLYDVDKKNNIGKIISQMINGWVDVAKDSWIFDIQGNIEVAPTLLFMIQAGVPLDQAVAFASQPVIRRYVEKQRYMKSTFGVAMGVNIMDSAQYRSASRREMLKEMGLNTYGPLETRDQKKTIYDRIIPAVLETAPDNYFSISNLDRRIDGTMPEDQAGIYDMRAFLHFLELEDMSGATTEVKLSMNFDTTKTTSMFAAREKLAKSYNLDTNNRIPENIRQKIQASSSIGSFNVQPFMINMISGMFNLRDSVEIRSFITENLDRFNFKKQMPGVFNDKQQFINAFRNDLTSYMLQRYIYDPENFDPKEPYKGANISTDVTAIPKLEYGAYVKRQADGTYTMYVDFAQIEKDFVTKAYSKESFREEFGIAPVSANYFSGNPEVAKNQYYKFVYERESLRQMIPFATYKETADFKRRLKELKLLLRPAEGASTELFDKKLNQRAYEDYLRDTALINKINIPFMMKDTNGYAKQFITVDAMYPDLKKQYRVLSSLRYVNNMSTKNLRFSENVVSTDDVNIYHDDLKKLANPNIMKVQDPVENERISNLFAKFPLFAFLQSGQDVKGVYSLGKIISTDQIAQIIDIPRKQFLDGDTAYGYLDEYWELFQKQYKPIVNEETGNISKRRMKAYYNLFYSESTASGFIRATDYDTSINVYEESQSKYEYFEKDVKNFVEKYPENSILVYDGAISNYDLKKADTGRVKDSYTSTVVRDMVATGQVPAERTFGLTTKKRGYLTYSGHFMTVKTDQEFDNFKAVIDKEINRLIELRDHPTNPKMLIFSNKGYGLSLLGYGRSETLEDKDLILKDPPAARAYKYLSEALYDNFGYVNPGFLESKAGEYVLENQEVTDAEIKETIKECYYS